MDYNYPTVCVLCFSLTLILKKLLSFFSSYGLSFDSRATTMFMEGPLLSIPCMEAAQWLVSQQQHRSTHISSLLKEMDLSLVMPLSTTPTTCFTIPLLPRRPGETTLITMVHQCLLHLHRSYHQVCVFICYLLVFEQPGKPESTDVLSSVLCSSTGLTTKASWFTSGSMMLCRRPIHFKSLRQALFITFICMPRSSTRPVA